MFRNNVYTFKSLPVEEKLRKWTDCCCTIVTAIFALTLFILACVLFTRNNFYEVNFPVDSTGKSCNLDQPNAPYMYFTNINDLTTGKYCVSSCPNAGGAVTCTSGACAGLTSSYSTTSQISKLGAFCIPTDPTLANAFWSNPIIASKNSLVNGYDVILLSLAIGVCLGILYLAFVLCFPRGMTYAVFILAMIVLLIAGILLFVKPITVFSSNGWNIALGIFIFLFAIFFIIFFFCYQKQIEVASIFMNHANVFLRESPAVFGYIPLFLILSFGLIVLCIWQYIAFGTASATYLNPGDLYFSSGQNMFLQVLNAIQFIWGLQFLRDAFNYVVSGNAVEWYFKANNNSSSSCCRPFTRLLCRNWGSVAGGSFLNIFMNFFDFIFDLFRCDPTGSCGKCGNCYKNCCCCCDYIFGLGRTDAYAYINLAGVPYCNASRQCEAMCHRSKLFESSQSCIRLYRIAAHVFLVVLMVLIAYAIVLSRVSQINAIILALIILVSYIAVNYFIDLHADASEGLMVCYLSEQNLEGEEMQVCPLELRNDIYNFEMKNQLIR